MAERIIDVVCHGATTRNCTVMLDGISCDGYKRDVKIGAFSHFHDDHIKSVFDCVAYYDVLVTHPVTFEAISALKPGMRRREQWLPQEYGSKYELAGGVLRLLKANHIPGSSQVHVELDGKSLLYSGDFAYPEVQTRSADYLVIDSTHGDPGYDGKTERGSVKNRMFEHIEENIASHPQILVQVASGTLQEIVRHFEIGYGKKMSDEISFVMNEKQALILQSIYKRDQKEFRDIVRYGSPDYWRLLNNDKKCVIFSTQINVLDDDLRRFYKIMVDKFRFQKSHPPIFEIPNGCRFNLASHASINGIYKYIESVNPKHVVTDSSRSTYGKQLARLIEQKFPRIKAEHRPEH